ncbi:MAG TPA: DUF2071 domain-containing protein [Chloroflexia bacterium]|jgi:hypothetical protein
MDKMLEVVDHRPWRLPAGRWIMTQTWHNLLFAHWPIPADALRAVIPPQLEIDTCDGQAWLGVVAFRLSGIRLRGLPEVRAVSSFPEINVRTYVTVGGKPGVYFMSLDANNPLALAIARPWWRLRYFNAAIQLRRQGRSMHFQSKRTQRGAPDARFSATYRPCSPPAQPMRGTLEHWLTERYCYYSVSDKGNVYRCETHHKPWPLQRASACISENTLAQSHSLELPEAMPLLHYAHYMKAVIWPLRRVPSTKYRVLSAEC